MEKIAMEGEGGGQAAGGGGTSSHEDVVEVHVHVRLVIAMGAKDKRGKKGNAAVYTTRNQAVRMLQVRLPEFRRLCILKGIHPREPKKKKHGHNKTYYHVKDIKWLLHEPLLGKFRDIKAYDKKIVKAKAKKTYELAKKLLERRPGYTLDHIVKERYPTFIDALRDLDDPLTMVNLFAVLPGETKHNIDSKVVQKSKQLALEFQAYVVRSHALRKVFASVKGLYYQAEVMGQTITWLVPHERSQTMPDDVDYKVMLTFLEFYQTMLEFINFKLYHDMGLKYPPLVQGELLNLANALPEIMDAMSGGQKMVDSDPKSNSRNAEGASTAGPRDSGMEGNVLEGDAKECAEVFKGLVFYVGRENPLESLVFLIKAFGGAVGWDGEGSPFSVECPDITHQVIDRPKVTNPMSSREYIQPQWVLDCVNNRFLIPTTEYEPGKKPPPHLSPFVDNEAEGYTPEYAEMLKRLKAASAPSEHKMEEIPEEGTMPELGPSDVETKADLEDQYIKEVELEAAGITHSEVLKKGGLEQALEAVQQKKQGAEPQKKRKSAAAEEKAVDLSEIMMSRKSQRLYGSIQKGKRAKEAKVESLKQKREMLRGKK